jgi:glutaredoxin 3
MRRSDRGVKEIHAKEIHAMEKTETQRSKHRIEVFSAGCPPCNDAVELIRKLAGDVHEVHIRDMQKADIAHRAKSLGVRSLPAVVIDGKLGGCCAGRGPDEGTIRRELNRPHPTG